MTEQPHHTGAAASAAPRRVAAIVIAFGVIGVGTWLHKRPPAVDAPLPAAVQESTASPAVAGSAALNPASAAAPATPASAPRAPVVPAAVQQRASEAAAAAMEKFRSPAEALRKVQLGLNGGTPDEVLEAARTLQMCSVMSGAPEAMYAMRDRPDQMPEAVKKSMDTQGGINNAINFAEGEARRCQVFDAATMGRRMELFQRAYEGGAESAAVEYLMALQSPVEKHKPDPALVAKLQADVRTAAAAGDTAALQYFSLATGDRARELGVTAVQRDAYRSAWKTIMDDRFPGVAATIEKATAPYVQPASSPALTGAEQAEANALAQRVVDAWRNKRKGG